MVFPSLSVGDVMAGTQAIPTRQGSVIYVLNDTKIPLSYRYIDDASPCDNEVNHGLRIRARCTATSICEVLAAVVAGILCEYFYFISIAYKNTACSFR